jgi:hypothetical protein
MAAAIFGPAASIMLVAAVGLPAQPEPHGRCGLPLLVIFVILVVFVFFIFVVFVVVVRRWAGE